MIITLSGPSSTGKTTLFENLKNAHHGIIESLHGNKVEFVEESIRKIIDENFDIPFEEIIKDTNSAIDLQLKVAYNIYRSYETMVKNKDTLYICDRSPLDNVVYNLMNYQSDNPEVMVKRADDLSYACSLMRSMYAYVDRVYLTQVDQSSRNKIERDGFRPTGYEHRRQLEIELFNTIFDFSPKVVKLPSTLNDRVTTILTDLVTLLRR